MVLGFGRLVEVLRVASLRCVLWFVAHRPALCGNGGGDFLLLLLPPKEHLNIKWATEPNQDAANSLHPAPYTLLLL